jgi:hypothetical protein
MAKEKNAPTVETGLLMYVGPTLRSPVLLQHRGVFSGGVPLFVRSLTDKDAELAACFVPVAESGRVLRELEGYPGFPAGEHSRRFADVSKRYKEER